MLQTEIAKLAMLMPLFLSCEEAGRKRAGMGQHADLVVELLQWYAEVLSSAENQDVLLDECDTSSVWYWESFPRYPLGVLLLVTSNPLVDAAIDERIIFHRALDRGIDDAVGSYLEERRQLCSDSQVVSWTSWKKPFRRAVLNCDQDWAKRRLREGKLGSKFLNCPACNLNQSEELSGVWIKL